MSVNTNVSLQTRMWRGYTDPGLPVGGYVANGTVVGDATGGNEQLTFIFKESGEPSSGRFYSIEQMDGHITNAVQTNVAMEANNFDRLGPFLIASRVWRVELHITGNGQAAIHYQQGMPPMPLFLGQISRLAGPVSRFIVEVDNVLAEVFVWTIQGYIWEPRSILVEGGLRRPLDALYGR